LRQEYNLPFLIASPILLQRETVALLLTGRMVEQPPHLTRLGNGDLETVFAITELLGSVMVRLRLQDVMVQAETDGLTGLWNRNTFQHLVESYLGGEENSGALMMIDVDYFKSVNDTYGHLAGDNLLKACAGAMRRILRDSDIIGRQGGDEFVVFCRGIKSAAIAKKKAAQISEAWKSVVPDGGTKHVTASIGIALSPRHGTTFQELYSNADAALYRAKERGRDGYVLFQPNP
jgi:diguanylate cyclase (GGDEF)-like protein